MENQLYVLSKQELEKTLKEFLGQFAAQIQQAAYQGAKKAIAEPTESLFLSKKQVCQMLDISYYSLQRLIDEGILETSPNGKKITKASLDRYLKQISQD